MAKITETSFGARLSRAEQLITFLSNMQDYNPSNAEDSLTSLRTLVTTMRDKNNTVATALEQYRTTVDKRQAAFRSDEQSLTNLLPVVRASVESHYGKSAVESKMLAGLIKIMRTSKVTKAPATPDEGEQAKKSVSTSQQSYGALTEHFRDIISSLSQFGNYTPLSDSVKLDALKQKADTLSELSNQVAASSQSYLNARSARNTQYEDLRTRVARVKAYVKGKYGMNSNEFKLVKGLSF